MAPTVTGTSLFKERLSSARRRRTHRQNSRGRYAGPSPHACVWYFAYPFQDDTMCIYARVLFEYSPRRLCSIRFYEPLMNYRNTFSKRIRDNHLDRRLVRPKDPITSSVSDMRRLFSCLEMYFAARDDTLTI